MTPAPTSDFSYDRDVAPHASRFFDKIGADPTLSHEAKMRLQGSLLGGVEGIEAQRLKLQAEREQGRARKLQYESNVMALEEARASRARAEQMEARRGAVTATAKSILDADADPDTKRQMLARTALDFADDRDALKTFDVAQSALPKPKDPLISDAQSLAMILDGIPQEEILAAKESGDFSRIGGIARDLKVKHEAAVENRRIGLSNRKDARAAKLSLAKTPLKFAEEEGMETDWMEDESTKWAKSIVETLGTDKDVQKFIALKGAPSDRERASLARDVQLRYLQTIAGEGEKEKAAKPRFNTGLIRSE